MNITYPQLHPQAMHAIRAAANWRIWGRFAAVRYCQRHGVPIALLRIARQLQVVHAEGF